MANLNPSFFEYLGVGATSALRNNLFIFARVTHVVQGPFYVGTNIPDPYYKNPTNLGEIAFQILNSPQYGTLAEAGNVMAKPIFPGYKQYPLEGELVFVVPGPSSQMNEARGIRDYYYFPPFNIWGDSHHNAFPDLADVQAYTATSVDRSYQQSIDTNQPVNTGTTGSTVFPLGPNFVEKNNIKTLRQFTGDVTVEGRWGNSIRLGSTSIEVPGLGSENNWSKDSPPGNPITIIRNGQGKPADNIPWIPTVEDINKDPSSIYLTQGQKIIINDIQTSFSLASLGVKLETVYSFTIPIQQQLTSTATTSPAQQDAVAAGITNPASQSPSVQQAELPSTAPTVGPSPLPTLRVVGDYQNLSAIDGSYVISLRVVDPKGQVLDSVSSVGSTELGAYRNAVDQIKAKNKNVLLIIPTLTSLIN